MFTQTCCAHAASHAVKLCCANVKHVFAQQQLGCSVGKSSTWVIWTPADSGCALVGCGMSSPAHEMFTLSPLNFDCCGSFRDYSSSERNCSHSESSECHHDHGNSQAVSACIPQICIYISFHVHKYVYPHIDYLQIPVYMYAYS